MKISQIAQGIKLSSVSTLILVFLIACTGSLSRANFEKVNNGMGVEEVKKLLGEPTSVETVSLPVLGTVTRYVYKTEKGEASVIFRDNQVQSKAGSISQ
ncbi:hypothetical protein Syn7502_02633 [Synechococcus sp. PCC 7502]|uniref:hypothetical protein n=1 Tax=Synechococcus sp. PCC 7502 TaxID=1173263 RepID=UPI00029F95A1|nr:hypothetical protein [Synechococcus sp. PCC 7502]AFY74594.1 hypothetical protein Syn7502_02633 [Synechococcus sp. PCC 7502]